MRFVVAPLSLTVVALYTVASQAEVLRLNFDTWAQGTSGKTVFVKFIATWCEHCKKLAPVWEQLAEQWKDHETGLVVEVDCSAEDSQLLCDDMEIERYPTILYGDPYELIVYEGKLELDVLSKFAKEHLVKPTCSPTRLDACDEESKESIAALQEKSTEELAAMEEEAVELMHQANVEYEGEMEELQRTRENLEAEHHERMDSIRKEFRYKLLRQVLASKSADGTSEEL